MPGKAFEDKGVYSPLTPFNEQKLTRTRPRFSNLARYFTLLCVLIGVITTWVITHDTQRISGKPIISVGHLFGKQAEELFLSVPKEASAISASRQFAAKPHVAGSPRDLATAKDFLSLLQRELGIKPSSSFPIYPAGSPESRGATLSITELDAPRAWIDTYYPVMNHPRSRSIQIYDDRDRVLWEADLTELSDITDPDAVKYGDTIPTFHGSSCGGDVKGKLVDGNYCRKEDYDALIAQNVSFVGRIVLCRYGAIHRGSKVQGAQELGAAGVLTYTDPRDDGTVRVENGFAPYPHGPARNPTSVQRGSVQFISTYPGDPTTPGFPSYENSTRIKPSNIPSIPSLPISWANAQKMFQTLERGGAWEGKQVRIVNEVDTRVTPIWNTIGVIPGYIRSEVVVIGNHRDAWVLGATDPGSGTASVHEVIRGFGTLLKKGWKPLRTILIASWDAEERGLVGSTEWGEDFSDWISEHVVAYLNLDSSVSGSQYAVSASPLLAHLVRQTAEEIPHPTDSQRTLWDATKDAGQLFTQRVGSKIVLDVDAAAVFKAENEVDDLGVGQLGSGSDYTVFLQRIGVPSTDGGFRATLHDPVYHYHSVFDSEKWQETYGDPGFFRHVAVAKHLGLQVLRLSTSIIIPLNTTYYAHELESYLDKVEKISSGHALDLDLDPLRKSLRSIQVASLNLDSKRFVAERELQHAFEEWQKWHSRLKRFRRLRKVYCQIRKLLGLKCKRTTWSYDEGDLAASTFDCDPVQARFGPFPSSLNRHETKYGDLAYGIAMHTGLNLVRTVFADGDHDAQSGGFPSCNLKLAIDRVQAVNKKLIAFERGLISPEGIRNREWYRHLGVAPGKWLGYGATTLPALTESITLENDTILAQYEVGRLMYLFDKLADTIRIT